MTCGQGALTRRCSIAFAGLTLLAVPSSTFGQGRGGTDWSTNGGDAQRSYWVRTDPKISAATMAKPGFQFMWKVKLKNEPLSAPVLMDRYIGYRGFRTYAFAGGRGEDAFALDSDLGRMEWQKHFAVAASAGSANCPGGMTAGVTRAVESAFPSANAGRGGGMGGRGGPAHSGVGEPLEGAVTIPRVVAAAPVPPPNANPARGGGGFGRMPSYLQALSSDGSFHTMYVSNGEEPQPAVKFLAPNANVASLSMVDGAAYAVTTNNCGGVADGVWALDPQSKAVASWKGAVAGDIAFGPTGTLYVASQSRLVSLAPKTLEAKSSYNAGQAFTAGPAVFEQGGKVWIAAATKDGVVHLIDAAAPEAAAAKSVAADASPYALASWQSAATRWIVATSAHAITAWKVAEQNGAPSLQLGWTSHEVPSPAAPLIVNGVLFALQSGDRSAHAVLHALDASSGKQLWTSGSAITSYLPKSGGLAAGGSSIYFGTNDGTLWAFGFPIEH